MSPARVAGRDLLSAAHADLHGAWVRTSASVAGSEAFETQHVVWLQAGGCYADIRVPFVGADERCFTGRSGWEGESYRWSRHLDLETLAGDDLGELSWDGDALIEQGIFPTPDGAVPYAEVWERQPGSDGAYIALEVPDACLVRVGDHAITVVDSRPTGAALSAAYRVLRNGEWSLVHGLGPDAPGLPTPDDPPDWPLVTKGRTEVTT